MGTGQVYHFPNQWTHHNAIHVKYLNAYVWLLPFSNRVYKHSDEPKSRKHGS